MSARAERYLEHAERLLLAAEAPGQSRDERRLGADLGQAWATLAVAVSDEIVDHDAEPDPEEWGRKDVHHIESLPQPYRTGFEQLKDVGHAVVDTGGVPLPDDDEVDVKRIVDRSISRGTLRPRESIRGNRASHPVGFLSRGNAIFHFPTGGTA